MRRLSWPWQARMAASWTPRSPGCAPSWRRRGARRQRRRRPRRTGSAQLPQRPKQTGSAQPRQRPKRTGSARRPLRPTRAGGKRWRVRPQETGTMRPRPPQAGSARPRRAGDRQPLRQRLPRRLTRVEQRRPWSSTRGPPGMRTQRPGWRSAGGCRLQTRSVPGWPCLLLLASCATRITLCHTAAHCFAQAPCLAELAQSVWLLS